MITLIIPYLECDADKPAVLKRCLDSLVNEYDELIIIDEKIDNLATKINLGLSRAKGDYLVVSNDDIVLSSGHLKDLCIPGSVTTPLVNNGLPMGKKFHGHMWCLPREVYEKVGGMYEGYDGFYYDDTDYEQMILKAGIPIETVESVDIYHPVGGRTLHSFPDWQTKYANNEQIYKERWG